jgi:hypothetical protein
MKMATVIYKYTLEPLRNDVCLPIGAQIIHIAVQRQPICLWAIADTLKPTVPIAVAVLGTGWIVPQSTVNNKIHIKTIQHPNGNVYHCFMNKHDIEKYQITFSPNI